MGDFGTWIARLQDHHERKTGMYLFPGTLNIQLEHEYDLPENCIRLEAEAYGGTVCVTIVRCTIFGRRAVILRTDKNETGEGRHSRAVVEIATDICLREHYDLQDGDVVSIEIVQ
ncbi:CTP-dependent riboflavin kinase [Candidatus Bipolaricaulota bacterium]|nr:CTP-dependent riboflavin kinase [Candidatus Bipolaricaulota bacterium]